MALSSITNRVETGVLSNVAPGQDIATFPSRISTDEDLKVYEIDSSGVTTKLTLNVHYTLDKTLSGSLITGATVKASAGGISAGKFADDSVIVVIRETDYQQSSNYEPNAIIPADTLENDLDKLAMQTQQLKDNAKRAIQFSSTLPDSETPEPIITLTAAQRANKLLGFSADGSEFAVTQEIGNYRSNWATGTVYSVRDIVKQSSGLDASTLNNIYICNTSHEANGSYLTQFDTSKWDLIVDAAAAASSASSASASASAAADDAADAKKLAINPEDSQYTLSDGATTGYSARHYAAKAAASASDADSARGLAVTAKNDAESAQAAAEDALTEIQGFYLGAQGPSDPTVDDNGDPVTAGDWYFNTSSNTTRIYNGTSWNVIEALPQALDTTDSPTFAGITAGTADIDGGTIDNATIGGTTPAAGMFTTLTATEINVGANLGWSASTDTYVTNTTLSTVTTIHKGMKRCVLNMDGSVNYYLDPADSTQKLDGTSATLSGGDGYVMVEIPKFYFRYVLNGSTHNWEISDQPLAGYQLHPAFLKDGGTVDYRYIGAYDACMYDASASSYVSGTNLDDMTGSTDTANDKLASVSGVYPIVGLTRDECRSIAENNGTGWRVADFWLISAIQMLYLVEHGDFYSQSILGAGNTNGSYVASSSSQNDSPYTVAGASNSWGNASTDGSQPSAGAKPGTAYMSYRGIENFYGNCWNWVDGINIGVGAHYNVHVSNTTTDFADDTSTNYDLVGQCASAGGYVQNISNVAGAFIPNDTTGASSSTYLTDYFYINTGNRVARFGGNADGGASAGAFYWSWNADSSGAGRNIGARVAY